MTVEHLRALAEAEAAAKTATDTAEATYRAAWWTFTLALADLDEEVTATLAELADVTGCSPNWLSRRRAVGLRVPDHVVEDGSIFRAPPTLALSLVEDVKANTLDAHELALLAEYDAGARALRVFRTDRHSVRDRLRREHLDDKRVTREEARPAPPQPQRTAALAVAPRWEPEPEPSEALATICAPRPTAPVAEDPLAETVAALRAAIADVERARDRLTATLSAPDAKRVGEVATALGGALTTFRDELAERTSLE